LLEGSLEPNFETHKALVTTTKYFLPIIIIVSIPLVTSFYFKHLKKINADVSSLVLADSFVLRNRQLLVAAKRYAAC
jgi:uncharacterized membrane protein